jgi:gas vesicle protein
MDEERMDERRGRDGEVEAMGVGTILAAFGLGLLAGAAVTLLTTPESGAAVRNRLKRGMETAEQELDEIAGEIKEGLNAVDNDVREAVKRTATRVKQAAEVTKEALAKNETSVRSVP